MSLRATCLISHLWFKNVCVYQALNIHLLSHALYWITYSFTVCFCISNCDIRSELFNILFLNVLYVLVSLSTYRTQWLQFNLFSFWGLPVYQSLFLYVKTVFVLHSSILHITVGSREPSHEKLLHMHVKCSGEYNVEEGWYCWLAGLVVEMLFCSSTDTLSSRGTLLWTERAG